MFDGADRFLGFAEYLQLRLRGVLGATLSSASGTGLLDLAAGEWDEELLEAVGVGPERLPPLSDEPWTATSRGSRRSATAPARTSARTASSRGGRR